MKEKAKDPSNKKSSVRAKSEARKGKGLRKTSGGGSTKTTSIPLESILEGVPVIFDIPMSDRYPLDHLEDDVDLVNKPPHYRSHPSGVECIEITQHMNFCLGNAMKYIWRCDDKGDKIENLEKAVWYLKQEIELERSKREEW